MTCYSLTWGTLLVFLLTALADCGLSTSLRDQQPLGQPWTIQEVRKTSEDELQIVVAQQDKSQRSLKLKLDRNMFSDTATVHLDGVHRANVKTTKTYMAAREEGLKAGDWATATILGDNDEHLSVSGVMSIDNQLHTFATEGRTHSMRLLASDELSKFEDVAKIIPGKSAKKIIPAQTERLTSNAAKSESLTMGGPFFPGCFPGDSRTLVATISIVVDAGYYTQVTSTLPSDSSSSTMLSAVIQSIQQTVAAARPLYLSQLNVQITIDRIVVGTPQSPDSFLRRAPNAGCATNPVSTLFDLTSWAASQPGSAHWHLMTNCHPMPGLVGAGYVDGLCHGSGYNTAVSSWMFDGSSWLVFAHEMGHVFGASHTFYGGLGGIMDYGSGQLYGGAVAFHPDNGPQICTELTQVLAAGCPYVAFSTSQSGSCGNGVLELGEDCECSKINSVNCGVCQKCFLTEARQCALATDGFVVRGASTAPFISVTDPSLIASAECCANGKLIGRSCNNGRDVCSITGLCQKACSKFLVPPCGFDASGCIQLCMVDGRCQGAEYTTQGPPVYPAGSVPDGLNCTLNSGGPGTCQLGVCVVPTKSPSLAFGTLPPVSAETPITSRPTDSGAMLTRSPSRPPSATTFSPTPVTVKPTSIQTRTPTSKPSQLPTLSPTIKCPRSDKFIRCPRFAKAATCRKQGCAWCGGRRKCQAASVICSVGPQMASTVYAHCAPFNFQLKVNEPSDSICPSSDRKAVCLATPRAKCASNIYLKCQFCTKQKACLPVIGGDTVANQCSTVAKCP